MESKKPTKMPKLIYSGRHGDIYRIQNKVIKYSTNPYELEILPTLNHKHVIQIYNVKDKGIEMDFIEYNLAQIIEKELPSSLILMFTKQISCGLNYIHKMEIKHHDLKPENIMISNDGIAKLIDFPSLQSTINYMSPEECFGGPITKEQDIWSLGCIVYEMINQTQLFNVDGEIPLICEMFKRFGTPTKETWPEWESLPDYGKLLFNNLQGSGLVVPDEFRFCLEMLKYSARPTAYEIYDQIKINESTNFITWITEKTRLMLIGKAII